MRRLLVGILLITAAAACARKAARIDVLPHRLKIYGLDRPTRLNARILDKKGQPLEIGTANWQTQDAAVAEVDSGGLVTPKSEGKTMVTAKYDAVATQVPVEVVDVKSVEIQPAALRLVGPTGSRIPLQAVVKNSKDARIGLVPSWTSASPAVATVSSDGVVTSVGKGVSMIIAKIGDVQGAGEVTVEPREIARLEVRPATALVRIGDHQQFAVIAFGPDGVAVEGAAAVFESTDPSVATVNPAGRAEGLKAGASTIRASLGGVRAEATLIVN